MCIKSGFYLVHRSSKSKHQLSPDISAYITLYCQHSVMYFSSKKTSTRVCFTRYSIDLEKGCKISTNTALCKLTNCWFYMNSKYGIAKKSTLHCGHIQLLPAHVSCSISMLSEEEHHLMSECIQISMNSTIIAQLATLKNKYDTDTMWSRHQVYYVQNRVNPFSNLNSNASSVPEKNILYDI